MEGITNVETLEAFDPKRNYSQKQTRKPQTQNNNDVDKSFSFSHIKYKMLQKII